MHESLRPTWDDIAYHWHKWGPPLRPCDEDLRITREVLARCDVWQAWVDAGIDPAHFPAYELGDRCPIIIGTRGITAIFRDRSSRPFACRQSSRPSARPRFWAWQRSRCSSRYSRNYSASGACRTPPPV